MLTPGSTHILLVSLANKSSASPQLMNEFVLCMIALWWLATQVPHGNGQLDTNSG